MKYIPLVWLVLTLPLLAQSTLLRQFEEAQTIRETALRQLDQQYAAKLKSLLERAERANDTEAKIAIREELEKYPDAQPAKEGTATHGKLNNKEQMAATLTSTEKCQWMYNDGRVFAQFRFLPDGKLEVPGSMSWLVKWEAIGANKFRVYHQDGTYWVFKFMEDTGFAKSVNERGAKEDETKTIRLLPKGAP